jgi:hypothetical protein
MRGYVSGTYVIPKNTKGGMLLWYIHGKQTMQRWLLGSTILLSIS